MLGEQLLTIFKQRKILNFVKKIIVKHHSEKKGAFATIVNAKVVNEPARSGSSPTRTRKYNPETKLEN